MTVSHRTSVRTFTDFWWDNVQDFSLLVYKCLHQLAGRSVPRVDDHSGFGSLYTSPFALGRSRRPGCAADQNCLLRSAKLLSRWSVSVEQSVAGNKDDITDTLWQFSGRLKTEMYLRSYTTRQRSRHNFHCKIA